LFGLSYQELPIEDYLMDHPELLVIGTDVKGGVWLSAAPIPATPFAIILGNEGHGVKPDLLKRSALRITIEMEPSMDSLNVGVAGSILMYHFRKRG
jgi:TrmH family RNA methyltransferase